MAHFTRRDDRFQGRHAFRDRRDALSPFHDEEVEVAAADAADGILHTVANEIGVGGQTANHGPSERNADGNDDAGAIDAPQFEPPPQQFFRYAEEAIAQIPSGADAACLDEVAARLAEESRMAKDSSWLA